MRFSFSGEIFDKNGQLVTKASGEIDLDKNPSSGRLRWSGEVTTPPGVVLQVGDYYKLVLSDKRSGNIDIESCVASMGPSSSAIYRFLGTGSLL